MATSKQRTTPGDKKNQHTNAEWQGVDKDPAEERGKAEKVTKNNLKGKKIDGDPAKKSDKPLNT